MSQVISAVEHRRIMGELYGSERAFEARATIHLKDGEHELHVGPVADIFALQDAWVKEVDGFLSNSIYANEIASWERLGENHSNL